MIPQYIKNKNTHEKSDLSGKFIPFANELVGCKPQPLSG